MNRVFHSSLILLSLFVLTLTNFYPQIESRIEHLNMGEGSSLETIYCILQDSKGFLWFGTLGGLYKYDGYTFKKYIPDINDDRSLSSNIINSIYEDRSGVIWIGTFKGLNIYNRDTDDFTRYLNNPNEPYSLSNDLVMSVYQDQSGTIWIGTDGGGLNMFDREQEKFIRYMHDPDNSNSLSHNSIYYGIVENEIGELWIGTYGGGLNKFNKKTESFTRYVHDPDSSNSLSDDRIFTIFKDKSGDLWIGTDGGGLNKFIPGINEFTNPTFLHYKHDPLNPNTINSDRVFSIYEDDSNEFWVATLLGGLNKFDKRSGQFNRITNISARSLFQDRSGILWIGTDIGVYKLDKKKLLFKHYKNDPDDPTSFSGITVFPFLEYNQNEIWIGSGGGGLNKFIRDKGEFLHYKHDPTNPNSLSNNLVLCLYKDEYDVLWIGTWGGGVNKLVPGEMNKAKPTFIHYKHNPNDSTSLCGSIVTSILKDSEGSIWIGTEDGGISVLTPSENNKSTPAFINYKHDPNDSTSLIDNRVYYIYQDRTNNIWIATLLGLEKFDNDNNQFIHYNHIPGDPYSLSSDDVTTIYEDKSGIFWIGTTSGLNRFDREENRFKTYTQQDGLGDNLIWSIIEDDYGNLWIGGSGLTKFNPKTETFTNYSAIDGLQSNAFCQNSGLKISSGEMFFGGSDGFNVFHPDSIKGNAHIPQIVITDFQLDNITVSIGFDSTIGRSILNKVIEETEEIELLHEDNVISFEFSALDYHTPEENQYAYMMEGFENDWKYTDATRRYATYTNLDPGEYNFRVKGSNNDGYWNEAAASIKIIILPPWWATTWAYLIYALILLSIIYFTWKLQLKRIRLKHDYEMSKFEADKMHEVDEMKSRFFANISHEFRTPLTLIFGPAKDISEKTKEQDTKQSAGLIKRNASRLYGLVNQLLDLSKLEAGKMKLEASDQNIMPLLKGLVLSFTSLAERKKITLMFNTIEEKLNLYLDKDKIEKIVNNLLSNAFKFTPEGGTIDITVEKLINDAEIRITDNGVGISKERMGKLFDRFYQVDGSHTRESEGTGIGLALTKELVELHKGKIKVDSNEGEGTTFTVLLPLGKDHLKPEEIVEKDIQEETTKTITISTRPFTNFIRNCQKMTNSNLSA